MENGGGNFLETKMATLALNDSSNNTINNNNDGLFQVIKAVEAAEATIKQQVEENNRLRSELQKKIQELETYKSGNQRAQLPLLGDQSDDDVHVLQRAHQIVADLGNQTDGIKNLENQGHQLSSTIVLQKNLMQNDEHQAHQTNAGNPAESNRVNGALRVVPRGQAAPDNYGLSHLSSPFMTSFAPIRYQVEGESDRHLTLSERGLMTVAELNSSSLKENLGVKIQEHEEEIMQLKKHLSEYSVKEAQIRNEKHVLEKRIAHMRMAFDQQQQDLVDAASKAISYRQDIIEENIRLTYALQDAQQERSAFVSSLMPLLAEYSLQPPVANAQSIVSNVKVLFRHLHEKLMLTEAKLKESQYQISPWRSNLITSNVTHSSSHTTGMKDGLELVPQPPYEDGNLAFSPDPLGTTDWDPLGHRQNGSGVHVANTPEPDDLWRHSPLSSSRNNASQNIPADLAVTRGNLHSARNNEETISKQVTFRDFVSSNENDDSDMERHQSDTEPSVTWAPKSSPYNTADEPGVSYSPYLPPVLEEPSSSFSEAADDDPLPGIEGLQISGEAFPGRELQACGYSINGTTSCNFEWVRHLEDGSFNYIDGAKQPNYLVTADDVDTYLAIEVQPLDNRKRKGELVKVFSNDHRKITCDPEMHDCIEKTLYSGHASYKVSLSMGYLDMWEPATLSIKKDGYSIKCSGASGVVVSEKYSPSIIVSIPFGSLMEFSVLDSRGVERLLRAENSSTDVSCCRDTIVLTLRLFILRANAKKKSKKRGLFFTK